MTSGYVPVPLEHFGGMVTSWPPEMLDVSVSPEARNVRFTQGAVASREGLSLVWKLPAGEAVRGIAAAVGTAGALVLGADGTYTETAPGSGEVERVGSSVLGTGPAATASAYGRVYIALAGPSGLRANMPPQHWDGTDLDPVTIAPSLQDPAPGDSTTAGNVAAGLRYCVVLYRQRDGSMTLDPSPGSWTAAGAKQATVGNIPTGPAQVTARIVAFTVAGGSSAGPYFYIPLPQTVNGVTETATVIEDNASTSAAFNFDDAFLASSIDVTEYFRQIQIPYEGGVFYSATTDRMVWWGEIGSPSLLRFSEPADAGLYLGDTGYMLLGDGDGEAITAAFEFRGQLYCAKERSLYRIVPNASDPSTWTALKVSEKVGCCSPRAVAVAASFVFLVGRGGAHLFTGGEPVNVSTELLGPSADRPGLWEQVNWSASGLIWCHADAESLTIRVGVPLLGATAPSAILKVSYLDGWDPSIRFSVFTARYHYFPGRRWSIDDIAAYGCWEIERPQTEGPWAFDQRQATRQILLASAVADGRVLCIDANAVTDDGTPFWSEYTTGAVSAAQKLEYQRSGVEMVGLVQVRARGGSLLTVQARSGLAVKNVISAQLTDHLAGDFRGLALLAGESVSLKLRSNGRWAALAMYAYAKPWAPQRFGKVPAA